ncbi:MAG: glutamine synthetase III [Erysipelotrichaceae bacterium]|nr:glutamine synthetase III [Erysipelotrichaceae bacterium]MDY5251699.1 glutamine synthetase III [Erysipelotrichaceae bacterium]
MLDKSYLEDFGSLVFNEKLMEERLPSPIYKQWKQTVANEGTLDRHTADAIAHAMKRWACENGATHFTHWFQPMTGSTAQKNDAFIEPGENGEPLLRFSGKSLIKGEPDASSFPSGGLRATFEARGYTYWDFTSPAFIRDDVLCIPSVFVSYNGESLDKKSPLLKSIDALNKASTRVVKILGDKDVRYCYPVVGLEQEYFLIDKEYFDSRLDLLLCNRTLFGAIPSKAQELDDHYFGSIPTRVHNFMKDVNKELWKLGIYAKAEHNEVAPGQFELAPIFSNANVAVDQNQIIMDVLKACAKKHDLACLLHEKPFDHINGSGKHNNFSIMTNDGQNLFSPGDKPAENIRFLVYICAFIKAVDTYPELLRMSASSAGNDHRLGANEAPPAIISIYLGSYIENILYSIYKETEIANSDEKKDFNPVSGLSYIPHDNADRNRTSPLAFTGNKFEFRMLGSSQSASIPNVILNSIMAESLNEIADELEGLKYLQDVRDKAMSICKKIIKDHKRIIFSGDGYSSEWIKEAKRRGLANIPSFIESVSSLIDPKAIKLFTNLNIFSEKELYAREEILSEQYIKTILIEAKTMKRIANNQILPLMINDLKNIAETNSVLKIKNHYINGKIEKVSTLIDTIEKHLISLDECIEKLDDIKDNYEKGKKYYYELCPILVQIRLAIDEYETIADKNIYTIPTYSDMLFKKL